MMDPVNYAVIGATFLVAGMVKGVIGLGLPTVSLAVLTVVSGLPQAMALMLVPSFVTNLWQAIVGGNLGLIIRRLWPFLLMATVMIWVGASALTRIDLGLLSALLGVSLITYSAINLAGLRLTIPERQEVWAGSILGAANGMLTGMTGSFVVPGVMYLQAIGLPRDTLIQAMGVLFTASTLSLAIALGGNRLLTVEQGMLSAMAVIPALAGMIAGQYIRKKLPEAVFRKVFFLALFFLGGYIIAGSAVII